MFVHNLVGTEDHPVYNALAAENLSRQYSFLRSITLASLQLGQPVLSVEVLKALNYHAISCLHPCAGEFRPCYVEVGKDADKYVPPAHYLVPSHMQLFTNEVNRLWDSRDEVTLASYVLWKLNYIHPFINGNGRTARATCHFVLCLKAGGWIAGEPILPALIKANRNEYVACLKAVDASAKIGAFDLTPLQQFIARLINEQISTAEAVEGTELLEDDIPAEEA